MVHRRSATAFLLYRARVRAPVRPISGRWPAAFEQKLSRFFRLDPAVLLNDDVSDDDFRRAMSSIYVGGTIKITGAGRHPGVDDLLLHGVDLSGRTIVDIGASDGSTSVELVARIPDFGAYVIADRYLSLEAKRVGRRIAFFDSDGDCVLVSGPRSVAWPSLSRTVSLAYSRVIRRAREHPDSTTLVMLLNPATRRLLAEDARVSYRMHDVFQEWSGEPKPDVMKIANLLRRLYFTDPEITRALEAVHAGLPTGGHLFIVDNPRLPGVGARGGLYQRTRGGFDVLIETSERPEISDLVRSLRAPYA